MEIAARGTTAAANKLLKVVKTFFGWCVARAILDASPAKGITAPAREKARDRVLSDAELAQIIRAARQVNGPYGSLVELLALMGQRREEVARLPWNELNFAHRLWTIPASRAKNGKPHIVHLSHEAVALPQETLAQLIGSTRQRVNQILKEWEVAGTVEQQYGHLTLLDRARLEKLAIS